VRQHITDYSTVVVGGFSTKEAQKSLQLYASIGRRGGEEELRREVDRARQHITDYSTVVVGVFSIKKLGKATGHNNRTAIMGVYR